MPEPENFTVIAREHQYCMDLLAQLVDKPLQTDARNERYDMLQRELPMFLEAFDKTVGNGWREHTGLHSLVEQLMHTHVMLEQQITALAHVKLSSAAWPDRLAEVYATAQEQWAPELNELLKQAQQQVGEADRMRAVGEFQREMVRRKALQNA